MKSFLVVICAFTSVCDSRIVKTNEGEVEGTTHMLPSGRILDAFLGIPFAEPPVEEYRFEPPQPKSKWDGIWKATSQPEKCVQYILLDGPIDGKEDCLYLSVFCPRRESKEGGLMKVLVYMHGGAFMFGTGSTIRPDYIMDKDDDLVFVAISYRVGPMGFFSANDSVAPGNYGLKDQVAALEWVQRNIRYFGGDPEDVTIQGMSSGAASVHYHLLSDSSEGLFQKAVSSSGTMLLPWTLMSNVFNNSMQLASLLSCSTDDVRSMMNCLKRKSIEEVSQAMKHFVRLKTVITMAFGPVIEPESQSAFLSEDPLKLLKRGKVKQVPWLVGLVETEGSAGGIGIVSNESHLKEVNDNWYQLAPYLFGYDLSGYSKAQQNHISSEIRKFYFNNEPISGNTDHELLQLFGDRFFFNGITRAVKLHVSAVHDKAAAYCYKLYFRGSESMCDYFCNNGKNYGVCHVDDQFYLANLFGKKPQRNALDVAMSDFLISHTIAFMNTGDPNTGDVVWEPLAESNGLNCLSVYSPTSYKMENVENTTTIEFWKNLLPSEYQEDS